MSPAGTPRSLRLPALRWDLACVGAVSLTYWVVVTPSSSYFLQIDTATQDYIALAWARGCWEVATEKMAGVYLLAPLFRWLGPSPAWESLLLALSAAITLLVVYELTRAMTGSTKVGIAAACFALALPAFTFFSHTYLGYLLPLFMSGWLAIQRGRWGLAGLLWGFAILAHFNVIAPLGLAGLALAFSYGATAGWRQWLKLTAGGLLPLVLTEALFFLYLGGSPTHWIGSVLHFTLGYANAASTSPHPDWLWVLNTLRDSNGWPATLGLLLAAAAPVVLRRDRAGLALSLTALGLGLAYTVQAGIGHSWLVPRLLAAAYPAWAMLAVVVIDRLIIAMPSSIRTGIFSLCFVLIVGLLIQTGLFFQAFGRTLNPDLEGWFRQAARESRPVRMQGNAFVGLYFAQVYGVELLVNDPAWLKTGQTGQAVLIFDQQAPAGLDSAGYTQSTVSLEVPDQAHPALTYEAARATRFDVWWPQRSSLPVRPRAPLDAGITAAYYPGAGCSSAPAYGNGTLWFYQLVLQRLRQRLGLGSQ
jgi:hypothetical protein